MDQKRDELLDSNVKGKNPLKDLRVRKAIYQAIDIEAIKDRIMGDAATPTALIVGPGVRGFQPDLNKRLPYDPEAAKALLAQAGYPAGFDIVMNCPNDRYVNDAQICLAVAANLARIGVKVSAHAQSKTLFFPRLLRREMSLYLLGYTPSTVDAHDALSSLIELAPLADAELVAASVAQVMGHQLRTNAPLDELVTLLESQRLLLVIDNCEHLVEAVSELAEVLVARTPNLHMLVTTQEPLRLPDEHLYKLGTLSVPGKGSRSIRRRRWSMARCGCSSSERARSIRALRSMSTLCSP